MTRVSLLTAFFGGAAIGAAAGLLFAPAKGEDTRATIADYLSKHGVNLNKGEIDQLVDRIENRVRECKG